MNRSLLLMFSTSLLLVTTTVSAQKNTTDDKYVKYSDFIFQAFQERFMSGKQNTFSTIKEIRATSTLLTDEKAPDRRINLQKGRQKALDDEEIFRKRKNSVFIFGKLLSSDPKALKFDLTGTAFVISEDGVCVTNYHVLKDLIRKDWVANKDSIYFIMSADKKIYLLDSILAFSKNNDLAVFKVSTRNDKLSPIPFGKPANPGAAVYCISHPLGHFYYFSKGIMARSAAKDSMDVTEGYNKNGRPPIRMEITADYGIGSSGGPILDRYGNLIGVVVSTTPVGAPGNSNTGPYIQMMVKDTTPVEALSHLLQNN